MRGTRVALLCVGAVAIGPGPAQAATAEDPVYVNGLCDRTIENFQPARACLIDNEDAVDKLRGVEWTSWTSRRAVGTGTLRFRNPKCTFDEGGGSQCGFIRGTRPARVVLSGPYEREDFGEVQRFFGFATVRYRFGGSTRSARVDLRRGYFEGIGDGRGGFG